LDGDYVLQPGFTLTSGGLSVGVWSNFDTAQNDSLNSTETDTIVSYTKGFEGLRVLGKDLNKVNVSVGHTYYDFPGSNGFSREYFLGLGYETFLAPTLTWYHDYGVERKGGGRGDYYVLGAGHSLSLVESYGVTLDLAGHVGYNKDLFMRGEGGDYAGKVGVTVPLTKSLSVSPSVNYSVPFGSLAEASRGNQKEEFFWGVGLAANF